MTAYRAVLFDWMLTLADYPPRPAMLRLAATETRSSRTTASMAWCASWAESACGLRAFQRRQ